MNGTIKIKLLLGVLLGIFVLGWILGTAYPGALPYEVVVVLCGSGIVVTLYVMNRLALYRKKFQLAMRHILDNNFQTGVSADGTDELAQLGRDFNRIVDRMNEYEDLRSKKIFLLTRLIKALTRAVTDAVMVFDLESGRIAINQATQTLFGISQDELSIDSVIRLEANRAFNALYQEVAVGKANTMSGTVEFYLPILRAKAQVSVNLFGIKDTDEKLHTVVCVLANA